MFCDRYLKNIINIISHSNASRYFLYIFRVRINGPRIAICGSVMRFRRSIFSIFLKFAVQVFLFKLYVVVHSMIIYYICSLK